MFNQINSSLLTETSLGKKVINLQNIIFPKLDICTIEELFFRAKSQAIFNYESKNLELQKGGIISFDTYFNSFSVETWKTHSTVRYIGASLKLQGYFKIRILNIDIFQNNKTLLVQKLVNNRKFDEVTVVEDLDISSYTGMIYIEIEALENNCQVSGGYLYSHAEQDINLKFAVVICTYKREDYVYRNLNMLDKYLLNRHEWKGKIEFFIVDNGKTLETNDNSIINVIPNKNAGGSGGFARGMIEVMEDKDEFSHIILMDDDVIFDPEIFDRLWNFLSVSTDPNICIGGSMLRLDQKYIQNERGAYWDKEKGFVPIKHNLNLTALRNTLINEIEEYTDYNGWWFFCLPTTTVKDRGLPYPFFVRLDDVELCKRIANKIVTVNGICVWHEAFENKFNPSVYYYDTRNGLILNNLYFAEKYSRKDAIKWFLKPVLKELFCYRYETATHILKATADFLKGAYTLVATDPEEKHREITKILEKPVKNIGLSFIYSKYQESINEKETSLHRFFRLLTLNGHLLPSSFFFSDETLKDKGYKIVPYWGSKPLNVFRAKRVLYYNLQTKEGFAVQFSRIRFFQILVNAIWLALVMFFKFTKVKRQYISTFPEFTSQAFWKKYLDIES